MEELYSHKNSAIGFAEELCKTRPKAALHTTVGLAIQAMEAYKCALAWLLLPCSLSTRLLCFGTAALAARLALCCGPLSC